jgi:O-antigen/teichoic acid export membrane protein
MTVLKKLVSFMMPKVRLMVNFFAAQGVTMAGNLLYGLLCVRLLPTADYAKFVVLFGVQGTLIVLMDVNFSGCLIPLIGERVDDLQLIRDYVASLRKLAVRLYAVVGVGLMVFYPILVKNRGWSGMTIAAMVATLLVSTWFMRINAAYGAVLILLRERGSWYRGQMIASLGTLALLLIAWVSHGLFGFTAILINVVGNVFCGAYYFYRAKKLLGGTGVASSTKTKAIVRLALPNIPQSIFYALQGQLSLFLITIFGHTSGVAGVGALGRLGQIFVLLMQMNPLLVEPYFAKLPKSRLKINYLGAMVIAGTVSVSACLIAASFPEFFLWILGPNYASLRYEVLLAITTSAISLFSGVLWCIHTARRFVYWWSTATGIALTLLVQVLFIVKADLSLVRTVLWLNLATNAASLFVNLLSGMYGMVKGAREVETPDPDLSQREREENDMVHLSDQEQELIASTVVRVHPE